MTVPPRRGIEEWLEVDAEDDETAATELMSDRARAALLGDDLTTPGAAPLRDDEDEWVLSTEIDGSLAGQHRPAEVDDAPPVVLERLLVAAIVAVAAAIAIAPLLLL